MATKTADAEAKADGDKAKGGKKKLIIIIGAVALLAVVGAVLALVLGGGGGGGSGSAAAKKPAVKHTPGVVDRLDAVTINLAGGHFLKVGLGLQQDASAGSESLDGAKALDATIELLSGKTIDELSSKDGRDKARAALTAKIDELYDHEIYQVYFMAFVMQ